jgi:hypothetical protein
MVQASTSPEPLELEMDLASLASQAAIDLDDLLLGRRKELTAVKVLAEKIAASLPLGQTMDATTAVAVQRALIETPGLPQTTTVNELVNSAAELTARLSKLVAKPEPKENPDEVKQLRSFCVALSRSSTALQGSPYDRPEHPFRR